jgi:hypothetical protein
MPNVVVRISSFIDSRIGEPLLLNSGLA